MTATYAGALRVALGEIRMAAVTTPGASIDMRAETLEGIHQIASTALAATDGNIDDPTARHLWRLIEDIDGTARAGIRLSWNAALDTAIGIIQRTAEQGTAS